MEERLRRAPGDARSLGAAPATVAARADFFGRRALEGRSLSPPSICYRRDKLRRQTADEGAHDARTALSRLFYGDENDRLANTKRRLPGIYALVRRKWQHLGEAGACGPRAVTPAPLVTLYNNCGKFSQVCDYCSHACVEYRKFGFSHSWFIALEPPISSLFVSRVTLSILMQKVQSTM